jgi:glutamyl-tRNA synthetase
MLAAYCDLYDPGDDGDRWFTKVKALSKAVGYADDVRAYKQAPGNWPGSVADVSMVLRLAIAGRRESPDLAEVMRVMGPEMVRRRLRRMMEAI